MQLQGLPVCRLDHRQDADPERFGQRGPGIKQPGQVGVQCAAFCAAWGWIRGILWGIRGGFDSSWEYLYKWQVVATTSRNRHKADVDFCLCRFVRIVAIACRCLLRRKMRRQPFGSLTMLAMSLSFHCFRDGKRLPAKVGILRGRGRPASGCQKARSSRRWSMLRFHQRQQRQRQHSLTKREKIGRVLTLTALT